MAATVEGKMKKMKGIKKMKEITRLLRNEKLISYHFKR